MVEISLSLSLQSPNSIVFLNTRLAMTFVNTMFGIVKDV